LTGSSKDSVLCNVETKFLYVFWINVDLQRVTNSNKLNKNK